MSREVNNNREAVHTLAPQGPGGHLCAAGGMQTRKQRREGRRLSKGEDELAFLEGNVGLKWILF